MLWETLSHGAKSSCHTKDSCHKDCINSRAKILPHQGGYCDELCLSSTEFRLLVKSHIPYEYSVLLYRLTDIN